MQSSSGLISAGDADFYGGMAASLGADVHTAAQSALGSNAIYWGVFSRTRDVCTPVRQVLVDNRPDVQRRRAASLLATHTGTFNVGANP